MARAYWRAPIPPFHAADGAAFSTFTAFQDIGPTPPITLFANQLEVGTEIYIDADGEFSTTGTPTLGLGFFYGTAAVVLGVGTATTTTTTAVSWPWHAEYRGRVRTAGSAGTINGLGWWMIGNSLTTFAATQALPATLALRTVTIDTTAAKTVGVGAVWGTSAAGNTIKVNRLSVDIVN